MRWDTLRSQHDNFDDHTKTKNRATSAHKGNMNATIPWTFKTQQERKEAAEWLINDAAYLESEAEKIKPTTEWHRNHAEKVRANAIHSRQLAKAILEAA